MTSPVKTTWTSVAVPGGALFDAYLATPPAGSGPGLVLFQEIFGVNEHIRAVAEQYALDGFVVLAPDIFWRSQRRVDLGYEGADRQRGIQLAGQLKGPELGLDMVAAVTALRSRAEVSGSKVGAIGYCMGGRLAFLAAATAGVDAAVAYYGGGIHDQLDKAASIQCPVQFHYAERDDHISMAAVDKVRSAMADKTAEVHVYEGAMHGFNCWARASYHAPSAALAHGRSLQFLAQNLF
jgi:carboxymethylenebutenolidase